jgi:hypothetical protein
MEKRRLENHCKRDAKLLMKASKRLYEEGSSSGSQVVPRRSPKWNHVDRVAEAFCHRADFPFGQHLIRVSRLDKVNIF